MNENDERRKNTPEEVAAIYAAALAGKGIEFRYIGSPESEWRNSGGASRLSFDFTINQFRIKPEPPKPRVIYVNDYGQGALGVVSLKWSNLSNAIQERCAGGKTIRFIEDLNWKEGDPE